MAKRGTFAFELSKPSKRGTLMKQGSLHKAFKYRFFVLYPGFLVYYESETKWIVDLAKGQTLGNRIGAIKLKNGTVNVARDSPKGCKFGLIVHAPDPVNKRQSYLLNALNKGDRNDWITAVRGAIPSSPKQPRKEMQPVEEAEQTRAPKVTRQDTATAAALLGSGSIDEEKETSIDSLLFVGQDNAAAAANSHTQQEEEEEEEEVMSIDDELISQALGSRENGRNDSSDEETSTDEPPPNSDIIQNGHASPTLNGATSDQTTTNGATSDQTEPEETKEGDPRPLEAEKKVESSIDIEGKVEVVTSVKVVACGSDPEEEEEEEREGESEREEGEKLRRTSAEVAIAEVKTALTITMVRENTVPSDTESDDDSTGDEDVVVPPSHVSLSSDPTEDEPSNCSDPPPDDPWSEPVTPATPAITIEKVLTLKKRSEVIESDVMSKEEKEAAALALLAKEDKRKCSASAPFIEKRGFLYKEGGQRKTWKLRYFVLQPGMFSYYKTSTATKPLGEVKLKNLQIRYPSAGERKQSFQFIVHTESAWNKRNNYVIAAQTNAEMKEWVTAFKLAGQKNITPACSPPGSSDDEATPPS